VGPKRQRKGRRHGEEERQRHSYTATHGSRPEDGANDSTKIPSEVSAKDGTEVSTEISTEVSTAVSTEVSTAVSTEVSAKDFTRREGANETEGTLRKLGITIMIIGLLMEKA